MTNDDNEAPGSGGDGAPTTCQQHSEVLKGAKPVRTPQQSFI